MSSRNCKIIMGIETSCDDTAVAIVNSKKEILSNVVINQNTNLTKYGGIVPEIAARDHLTNIEYAVQEALEQSKSKLENIDLIAATGGPGLIGGVIVGTVFAKSLAMSLDKPYIAVNHLEGHALSPKLNSKLNYPYLLLLISGGHSQYLIVKDVNSYEQIGTTIDDALGEAFDKTAKMLDLGYPGGPNIEKFSKLGDKNFYKLPEPIINKAGCNLSFAGLKTAVLIESKKIKDNKNLKYNLAASFQHTVNKILTKKTSNGLGDNKT